MRPTLIFLLISLLTAPMGLYSQEPAKGKVLTISWKVGDTIDLNEKLHYDLFPYYTKKEFRYAQFVQNDKDGSIVAAITMGNNKTFREPYTKDHYYRSQALIHQKVSKDDKLMYADTAALADGSRLFMLSVHVGEVIDSLEKDRFKLFSSYTKKEFRWAKLYETKSGEVNVEIRLTNGRTEKKVYSRSRVEDMMISMSPDVSKSLRENAARPMNTAVLNNGKELKGRVVENRAAALLFETDLEVVLILKTELKELK